MANGETIWLNMGMLELANELKKLEENDIESFNAIILLIKKLKDR